MEYSAPQFLGHKLSKDAAVETQRADIPKTESLELITVPVTEYAILQLVAMVLLGSDLPLSSKRISQTKCFMSRSSKLTHCLDCFQVARQHVGV